MGQDVKVLAAAIARCLKGADWLERVTFRGEGTIIVHPAGEPEERPLLTTLLSDFAGRLARLEPAAESVA